jgi:hypothetical protein
LIDGIDFLAMVDDAGGVTGAVPAFSPVAAGGLSFAGLALLFSARTGTDAMVRKTKPANHTFTFRIDSHPFRFRTHDFYSIRARQGGLARNLVGIAFLFHRHRMGFLSPEGGNIGEGQFQPGIKSRFVSGNATR